MAAATVKATMAAAVGATLMATADTAAATSVETIVDYQIDGARHRGYVYYDDSARKPLPIVLLVPNWMGTSEDNLQQAREVAGKDYLVFVADMYGHKQQPADTGAAGKLVGALYGDRALLRKRVKAAKDEALRAVTANKLPGDPARVAVIGFCFGGATALELARSGEPLAAAVSIHGNLSLQAPIQNQPFRTRILALHGDVDPYVPADQVEAFETEMRSSGVDWQLVRFGGAVHSFTDKKANQPGQFIYEPKVARRAFAIMRDFLDEAFAAVASR